MSASQPMDSLTIRGFRGLEHLTLEGLGRFNLLLGANDVGKTSVMEAVFLLSALYDPKIPGVLQQSRTHPFRDIADLTWIFQGADLDGTVKLTSRSGDPPTERSLAVTAPRSNITIKDDQAPSGNGVPAPTSPPSSADGPRSLRYEASVELTADAPPVSVAATLLDKGDRFEVAIDPAKPPPGAEQLHVNVTYIGAGGSADPEVIGEVIVNKKKDVLLQYLRHINPRVRDIAIADDMVYLDISLDKLLPLSMFGAGMSRAAQILGCCLVKDIRILLVDEIENGLHYRAIPPLLEALLALTRERDVQVFATSHRLGIIRGLQEVLAGGDFAADRTVAKCFTLQRNRAGLVCSYRYDYSQFDHCIRHELEMR